MIRPAERV